MHERLREIRKKLRLKQCDLAKSLEICPATYNRYEKGVLKPDIFKLCKIADAFNVSVDYLLMRTEIPCLMDNFLFNEEALSNIPSQSVIEFINKYTALDKRSKATLDVLLDYEYKLAKKTPANPSIMVE